MRIRELLLFRTNTADELNVFNSGQYHISYDAFPLFLYFVYAHKQFCRYVIGMSDGSRPKLKGVQKKILSG